METEAEYKARTKHRVTKGKRNLVAEFEEKNKERIDEAVRLMKEEGASNYEVRRQVGFSQPVVHRIRKQRVDMVDHVF